MIAKNTFSLTAGVAVQVASAGSIKGVAVVNPSGITVCLGDSDVTTSDGLQITAGETYTLDLRAGQVLWAIADGTAEIVVLDPQDPGVSASPARLDIELVSESDLTPPAFSSATVNSTSLVITFNEALAASTPAGSAFTVTGTGSGSHTVSGVVVAGTLVTLTLAVAVYGQEQVTVAYTKPGSNKLKDSSNNEVSTFTAKPVTNSTTGDFPAGTGGSATVVTSTADLPASPVDGDLAVLRVGTYPNMDEVMLKYNTSASKWMSDPITLVTQSDAWAMDLNNRTGTALLDWSVIDNPSPTARR
jgi:uncharacterized repeat protein (TIGR02059 family)